MGVFMKKFFLFVVLILSANSILFAARLQLPEIDINSSNSTSVSSKVEQQVDAYNPQTQTSDFNFPELDKFSEETINPSDVQLTDVASPDYTSAFGNLENLTKTLQSNFQNAFSTIKSLNAKYNSLSGKYQSVVKKYNNDVKLILGKAQVLKKQYISLSDTYKKTTDENNLLKQKYQQQEELINNLKNSINQKNSQLQSLSGKYEKLVNKVQQIKSALTVE